MLLMMEEEQEVWRIGNPDIFMLPQLMVVFPIETREVRGSAGRIVIQNPSRI
jgi:hypothetical protein